VKPVAFADVPRQDWDDLSDGSPQAWLFHRHDWIQLEATRFVRANHSFALLAGERIVGIQPLYLSDSATGTGGEKLLHCGIHRHTGLALHPGLARMEVKAARSAAMERILAIADRESVDRIQLNAHNLAPENLSTQRREIPFWVEDYGFQLGLNFSPTGMAAAPGMATCNADQIVELVGEEKELFARLDEACRRAVRKAQSRGLELEATCDPAAIERYHEIACVSARRTSEELPAVDYYRDLWRRFGASGNMTLLFARRANVTTAGMILLVDKGAANFFAGASLPEELPNRVNDFLHWSAMVWAKNAGLLRYRLGPSFPEVPADWPIARVSRFKTKFGGSSHTVLQGSLFLRPEKYTEVAARQSALLCVPKLQAQPVPPDLPAQAAASEMPALELIEHHLRLMGWPSEPSGHRRLLTLCEPGSPNVEAVRASVAAGASVLALQPDAEFCAAFGVRRAPSKQLPPTLLGYAAGRTRRSRIARIRSLLGGTSSRKPRLRTLHAMTSFSSSSNGAPVVIDDLGAAVWLWQPVLDSGILFVGTDLAGDLLRYLQGDPAQVLHREHGQRWGFAGERPNYLFDTQREGEAPHLRHADEWSWALTHALAMLTNTKLRDILPGGAPGAIVITGDDDQASLACYQQQLALLGDAPVTYFLHPLTKHTRGTLDQLRARGPLDLGLHPDALEHPDRYSTLCAEQCLWFTELAGRAPASVRNHGFLNDGYWGHLPSWLAAGIKVSSNLPGLDGNVLNGSLLPARVAYQGKLTDHWSILALIGDGAIFVNDWDAPRAARCVHDAADHIRSSGIPGVMVLNLHPENYARAEPMHRAALDVIRSGFVPWTLQDCLEWFESGHPSSRS